MDKNARIIRVDDDENLRKSMNPPLEGEEYYVDFAATGRKPIEMAQQTVYNTALLNIDCLTWKA